MAYSWITHNPLKKMEQISPSFGSSTCNAYYHGVSFIFSDVKGRRWSGEGCELVWRKKKDLARRKDSEIKKCRAEILKTWIAIQWTKMGLRTAMNKYMVVRPLDYYSKISHMIFWCTPFSMLRFLKTAPWLDLLGLFQNPYTIGLHEHV